MIRIKDLRFRYPGGAFALAIDDLDLPDGQRLCVTGPSGSGKTTLVNLISGILKPRSGSIEIAGREISKRNDRDNRAFRLDNIGFIFQNFELLEYLTVEQNILLPWLIGRKPNLGDAVRGRVRLVLEKMGITEKRKAFPKTLSHGERQRAAICRAVANEPALIIADEPTANLDKENSRKVMDLIEGVLEERGATFLLVTHDESLADRCNRRVRMAGGRSDA